jgi:hypothetical protein
VSQPINRYLTSTPTYPICITQNPATDINPEQTSSWFSFLFFFFLGDVISKASRVPHLPAEEFPPTADYDWAPHLMMKSFPVRHRDRIYATCVPHFDYPQYLDPLSGTVSRHMFFGLMRIFRREYICMSFLLVAKVCCFEEYRENGVNACSSELDRCFRPDRNQWLAHLFG